MHLDPNLVMIINRTLLEEGNAMVNFRENADIHLIGLELAANHGQFQEGRFHTLLGAA